MTQVLRSQGQPQLSYILLSDSDLPLMQELLRKRKDVSPEAAALAKRLRPQIKKVMKNGI